MDQHVDHAAEQAVIAVSSKSTVGGTVMIAASDTAQRVSENVDVLTISDYGIYVGMAVAVAGFVINSIAHIRRDRRERDLHEAEMRRLDSDCEYD